MKSKKRGIARIIAAFGYSFAGLRSVFRGEAAFRQDISLCVAGAIALCFMQVSRAERLILILSLFLIIIAELANTAIETIIDRIGAEKHPLSKQAKDIGSAIVLASFAFAIICWGMIIAR